MNEPQTIKQATNAIKKILELLQIARVVCVDDIYDDEPPIEKVVLAACAIDIVKLREIFPELGDSIPDDQDVLKTKIRQTWSGLEQMIRSDRGKSILTAAEWETEELDRDDLEAASILGDLLPKDMFVPLTERQWEERRDQLLQENVSQRTLFLFDQDLSKKGGAKDGGIKIISSLLADQKTSKSICGLLTHTVTPERLHEEWESLSSTYSINRDMFLIIPKRHLREDQMLFPQTLKWVALSPDFYELKQKTKEIIKTAVSTAAERIEAINIYDLDQIVFQVSAEEGLWEPDMLFRLHSLFHRLEARKLAHEERVLEAIASRLRKVSDIPVATTIRPESKTWHIQRDELYEHAQYLNENHLPLELGDIFSTNPAALGKCYILLAQPCDLMVRKRGKREPERVHVPLAEVVQLSSISNEKERDSLVNSPFSVELEYFGSDRNDHWYVKLKHVHHVRVDRLDLCVFNKDGSATFPVSDEAPDALWPYWKKRHEILSRPFNELSQQLSHLSQINQSTGQPPAEVFMSLAQKLLDNGMFAGKQIGEDPQPGIAYDCYRIGRLCLTRSFGLLMKYTGSLSRPAYDRDFG